MRSSAPSSRAMAMIPEAPPAIIENAPVTGLIPRCSRSSCPAPRLSASVATVTARTGQPVRGDRAQGLEARRASRSRRR